MKLRIKICGLTRPEDAELSVRLGATHIGCTMISDSPRLVTTDRAKEIFSSVTGRITKVLVFRSASASVVQRTAAEVGTKDVQLHNFDESAAKELEEAGLRVHRVYEIPTGSNALPPLRPEPSAKRPAVITVAGGVTNITFPWEILGPEAPPGTFISGAVRPENVCALLTHHPFGIDLCSGVEHQVGLKDPDRLELLFDTLAGKG